MIFNDSLYNKHWKIYSLEQLGDFSRGKSKHRPRNDKKLFIGGTIPFIQTGEIKVSNLYINSNSEYYNEFGLKQSKLWDVNTLCITIAANIAETALLKYPACFPDSVVGFNANNLTSEEFMYYIFKYIKTEIQKRSSGSTQDNINVEYLKSLRLKIPSKIEQDKILSILLNIDKKIDINNQTNSELESIAKTLYDYWFLQFEFPNAEGKPYKSSDGKMVYNEQLKKEIPQGWEVSKISNLSKLISGYPFKTENFLDGGKYKIYTIRNVQDGFIDDVTDNNIDFIPKDINKECILSCGDLIVSLTGNVGRVGLVFEENALLNQRVLKIKSQVGFFNYIYLTFRENSFKDIMQRIAGGTSQKNLSPNQVGDYLVVKPNNLILELFNEKLNGFFDLYINNLRQNQELTKLRDFLLPLLMNGQVTIKDAEEQVCEVIKTNDKIIREDDKFELWLQNQGLAARGDVDLQTLREIFDAMDENDK